MQRTNEVDERYSRDDARANRKNVLYAHIAFLWRAYTLLLPNDENGVREKTLQGEKPLLAYSQVGKRQRNVYVSFGVSKSYFSILLKTSSVYFSGI
ncbi:hypothetical protein CAPN002_16940 [Capnocytophaga stomatis]|nr:hypothetical protein CAPN002_16940 [Capnocytophaga stomatis]